MNGGLGRCMIARPTCTAGPSPHTPRIVRGEHKLLMKMKLSHGERLRCDPSGITMKLLLQADAASPDRIYRMRTINTEIAGSIPARASKHGAVAQSAERCMAYEDHAHA